MMKALKNASALLLAGLTLVLLTACGGDPAQTQSRVTIQVSSNAVEASSENTSTDSSKTTTSATASAAKKQDTNSNSGKQYNYVSSDDDLLRVPFDPDREDGWKSVPYDDEAHYDHTPSKGSQGPKNTDSVPVPASSYRAVRSASSAKDAMLINYKIECANAVKAGNEVAQKIADANGIIRHGSFILQKNSSAYDLLCSVQVDPIDVSWSMMGVHVKSIRSLAEKDCGSTSAWVVFVNGKQAKVAPDKVILSDGDLVEWRYTVKEGDLS